MRYEIPSIGTTFDRSEAVPQEGPVNLRILCESSHGILVEVMGATKTVLPWQYYDIVANKEPVKITPIDGYDSAIRTYKVTRIIYPNSIDYLTDESDILCSTVGLEDIENLDEKIDLTKTNLETEISTVDTNLSNKIDGVKSELQGNINTVENNLQQVNTSLSSEINQTKSDLEAAENNIEVNKNTIDILQIDKANRGYLQFNKAKLSTSTNNAKNLPLTLCLTYDCDDWSPCVGKGFGSGIVLFNTEIVDWSKDMHYGFNFGVYSGTGNAHEIHLVVRIANNFKGRVANNYISFNMATGKHTLCVSISEITDFAVRFYQDGAFLGVCTNTGGSTSMLDNIGGATGIHIATMANYATTGGQTLIPNLKLSRLKIFNCVLPATKADDTDGIGYTIEDYNNGVDEPLTIKNGKDYQPQLSNTGSYALYGTQTIGTNAVASIDSALNALVVSLSADTTPTSTSSFNVSRTYYPYKIKVGDKISIKIASATRNGDVFNNDYKVDDFYKYEICSTNENNSTTAVEESFIKKSWSDANIEETVTAAKDASYIAFRMTQSLLKNLNTIPSGTELYRWTGVEIKVNGALLSLADYTFNGEVLDASGNGNHASIKVSDSGSVKGTNDNAVEMLYQKIAARISNNS